MPLFPRTGPLSILQFGGVGDGVADNTAAFNAAFAFLNTYGGSLYIPAGYYRCGSACAVVNITGEGGGILVYGDGAASQILIDDIGTDAVLFAFTNGSPMTFRDLAFRSYSQSPFLNDQTQIDCGAVIKCGTPAGAGSPFSGLTIEKCFFIGLYSASTVEKGFVSALGGSRLTVLNTEFGGCANTNGACVYTDSTAQVVIDRTDFIDYYATIGGDAWGKVGAVGGSSAWVLCERPTARGAAHVVDRSAFFDEGSQNHVKIGDIGDPPDDIRFATVLIEDCYSNVSNTLDGHLIQHTDQAVVKRCTFAWANVAPRPAVTFNDVGTGEVIDCTFLLSATQIVADVDTQCLVVRSSTGYVIDSVAQRLLVDVHASSDRVANMMLALAPTGWWRGGYYGSPWEGQPSSGPTGSRTLAEGTHPATVGVGPNNLTAADFSTNERLFSALPSSDFVGASSGFVQVTFKVRSALADPGNYFQIPALWADFATSYGLAVTSTGIRAGVSSDLVTYDSVAVAADVGEWHTAQMYWDGTNVGARVDDGDWVTTPQTGPIGDLTQTPLTGNNYANNKPLDGLVEEIVVFDRVLSVDEANTLRDYAHIRYPDVFPFDTATA